jgi:hypothetical protein
MRRTGTVVVGLGASVVALALAPALMPDGYSWLSMTTSESAAQGAYGAWLARLGFVLFGLSVLLLASVRRAGWGPTATALHAAFGLLMLAAAGVLQQAMFAVAYAWYAAEALRASGDVVTCVTKAG